MCIYMYINVNIVCVCVSKDVPLIGLSQQPQIFAK